MMGYLLTMLADVAIQRVHSRGLYQPDSKVTADVESSLDGKQLSHRVEVHRPFMEILLLCPWRWSVPLQTTKGLGDDMGVSGSIEKL